MVIPAYKKCAITTNKVYDDETCFETDQIKCLLGALGAKVPKNASKKTLWVQFVKSMKNRHGIDVNLSNEWIDNYAISRRIEMSCPERAKDILRYTLRNSFKGNKDNAWTSDSDLTAFARQLERSGLVKVKFMGTFNTHPWLRKCKSEIKCENPLLAHFRKHPDVPYAVILNTTFTGQHWVALFQESLDSPLEFFDSFGKPAPPSLYEAIQWLQNGVPNPRLYYATKQHQTDNFSCGPYSLYFIVMRSLGYSFAEIDQATIDSAAIREFRSLVFETDPELLIKKKF